MITPVGSEKSCKWFISDVVSMKSASPHQASGGEKPKSGHNVINRVGAVERVKEFCNDKKCWVIFKNIPPKMHFSNSSRHYKIRIILNIDKSILK